MVKTGIVMKTNKNCAVIMTGSGKFYKVSTNRENPKVGEEFTGEVKNNKFTYKSIIAAASILLFVLLGGTSAYAYYSPVTTVNVDINPSIELKLNMFDRIISSKAMNDDGEKILKDTDVINKPINDGLNMIIEQSKKENFINDDYIKKGNIIDVQINSKKEKEIDLSDFQQNVKNSGLSVDIVDVNDKKGTNKNNSINEENHSRNNNGNDSHSKSAVPSSKSNGNKKDTINTPDKELKDQSNSRGKINENSSEKTSGPAEKNTSNKIPNKESKHKNKQHYERARNTNK